MIELPAPEDPLGEALHFLRMSGTFYCRSEFTAPWALELPAFEHCLMFHVVMTGQCLLEVDGAEPRLLRPGDLALVPHGAGHRLMSEAGVPPGKLFDLPRDTLSNRYEVLRHGEGGAATTMICALVRFDHPAAHQLIRLLPKLICVDTWKSPEMEWIQSTLRFIAAEAQHLNAGGETVITRLADILVILAIRAWIAQASQAQTGWLGALRDKQIGRAIAMIHRDPASAWTVASLADAVGMSRSAFSARFTKLVGEPAMHYAVRWKMQAALTRLRETDSSLAELANSLGYDSEAAFSRAFKRITGVSPGAARRTARADAAEFLPGRHDAIDAY
ncbi:AraC family transcriptional regulator [Caballeronia udeis]|uniref:AraC family transcriptional regulator n=1 Tax=Caballeronia udeis TaxID=1232866 RepID=A0A158FPL1_9BURK|nr:AraC family transcriptional regulator [Caballeronia udeis]SAL21561.1 AraC family transcriptional regulator [Caballeronia udeis]